MPLSEYTLHRRVAFHEVDSAGIVHFSVYFRYMEEAEHAMWRQAGLSIAARGANVGFPRVSAGFDYHRPLRFEDEFDARIRIVAIGDKSMRYVCTLNKGEEKVATGTITVVCVTRGQDGVMRAQSIPPEIAGRFEVSAESEAYTGTRLRSMVSAGPDPSGSGGVVTATDVEASKHKRAVE